MEEKSQSANLETRPVKGTSTLKPKLGKTPSTAQSAINSPRSKMSKIPTRETSSVSHRNIVKTPPPNKRFTLRKKSKTSLDLTPAPSCLSRADSPLKTKPLKMSSTLTLNTASVGIHRAGEMPSYLKKFEKGITEAEFNAKKRVFNVQRKKLTDLQSNFLMTHKALQEMLRKFDPSTEKIDSIGEVKLVAIVENDTGKLLVRDEAKDLSIFGLEEQKASPRNISSSFDIEQFRSKLELVNEAGFKLCQEFLENLNKIQCENEVGDGNTLQDHVMSIIRAMGDKMVDEQNEQTKNFTKAIKELQTAILKKHINAGDNELTDQLFALDEKTVQISDLNKQLEEHKSKLELSESKLKLLRDQETKAIQALKNQLCAKESLLVEKDMEILKSKEYLKKMEESFHKEEKKASAISKDLQTKESTLHKLERDFEELRIRCTGYESAMAEVKRQKEGILDNIRKDDRSTYETKLYNEVQTLKIAIDRLKKEKQLIENQREEMSKTLQNNSSDDLKLELVKMKDEIEHLNKTNDCLRDNIGRLQNTIAQKVAIINELEKKIANGQHLVNASKDLQNEISNLRESESDKKREVDLLRSELAKAHIEIKQQEETMSMNQRLLRIRSELIDSLQEKEKTARCRMDDLYSEISKKRTLVNQMNNEISAKAEELQNLFSTLGTKQLEVNRQENIIKMLEENNERNQRLRVKQEDRIARLETENAELKRLLPYEAYDFNKISRQNYSETSIKLSKEDENVSTRDIFDNERRKKRRRDIEVKKIHK